MTIAGHFTTGFKTAAAWAPTTVYAPFTFIQPNPANGYLYLGGGGTSGSVQPTWPTAIGANVGALLAETEGGLDEHEVRPFRISREAFRLAKAVEDAGRSLLVAGLRAVVAGERAPPAFPGAAVIAQVFGKFQYTAWAAREPARARTAQLVDFYNFNNPLKYSGDDYAKYPPWARLDEIEPHLGELSLRDLFERGVEPFLDALRPGVRVEVIAERTRAEQEKLDGAPVAADSSWLD